VSFRVCGFKTDFGLEINNQSRYKFGVVTTLGLKVGAQLILRMVDGEAHMLTPHQAIKRAQALVKKHVPLRRSLVRELIRERRDEAAHE
jgi:hypothetical protein